MGMSPSGKASDFDSDKGWLYHPLVGSNPTIPAKYAGIAQLAEQRLVQRRFPVRLRAPAPSPYWSCSRLCGSAHYFTAISVKDTAGCTRCSSDVGFAAAMRRGGIYVDVAQEVEQPRNGVSLVQVQSSADVFAPKATELTPRKDEGMRWHSSVGRAPVLYSGCRGFESCCQLHPHER